MYYYKRISGLIYLFIFSAGILLNNNLYAFSSEGENHNLDSVYNAYLSLKGRKTENFYPHVESLRNNKGQKCSFGLISTLMANYNKLNLSQQKVLSELIQRPALEQSIVSPSGRFRIHFNTSGDEAPRYDSTLSVLDNVHQVAIAFDSASSYENDYLGYPFPPSDNGLGDDNLYDIYIINYAGGAYGETLPDDENSSANLTSFIQIDNNYSKGERYGTLGFDGMRVTAAHEYHHAIQVGNYGGWPGINESFFYELTSTSMEEFVYNTINDYYNYLGDYFNSPDKSFPTYAGYELCIWNFYLVKKFGFEDGQKMIKRQWELKLSMPILSAINTTLVEKGSSFKDALNEFGIWSYFTGYRKLRYDKNNDYFDEGANYPIITLYPDNFTPPDKTVNFFMKPLSNNFSKFINTSGTDYKDSIVVIETNSDYNQALINPDTDIDVQLTLANHNIDGGTQLYSNYYWRLNSSQNSFFTESGILNDISPRRRLSSAITTNEEAYPLPFNYQTNSIVFIPTFNNDTRYAELKIFTVSMNLVYSRKEIVSPDPNNHFVVEWNGLDSKNNKLPTGVYIYVTSSDDKIKMGKLVIENK